MMHPNGNEINYHLHRYVMPVTRRTLIYDALPLQYQVLFKFVYE